MLGKDASNSKKQCWDCWSSIVCINVDVLNRMVCSKAFLSAERIFAAIKPFLDEASPLEHMKSHSYGLNPVE